MNGTLRAPPTLSCAVRQIDHCGSEQIAVADPHVYEHRVWFERAEQPVEIVQELPVLMQVPQLWNLLQVRESHSFTRELREIVAKTGTLHFVALLTGEQVTGLGVELSGNRRLQKS